MRKATGNYRTYSIPSKTAVLVPEFVVETGRRQNCSLGFCACSEGPALGQNTDDDDTLGEVRMITSNTETHCILIKVSWKFQILDTPL